MLLNLQNRPRKKKFTFESSIIFSLEAAIINSFSGKANNLLCWLLDFLKEEVWVCSFSNDEPISFDIFFSNEKVLGWGFRLLWIVVGLCRMVFEWFSVSFRTVLALFVGLHQRLLFLPLSLSIFSAGLNHGLFWIKTKKEKK